MQKQTNGITLIALVITIIVMLVLAGVTINVVVNGGLIEKAREAKNKTKQAMEDEERQMLIAIGMMDDINGEKNDKIVSLRKLSVLEESMGLFFVTLNNKEEYELIESFILCTGNYDEETHEVANIQKCNSLVGITGGNCLCTENGNVLCGYEVDTNGNIIMDEAHLLTWEAEEFSIHPFSGIIYEGKSLLDGERGRELGAISIAYQEKNEEFDTCGNSLNGYGEILVNGNRCYAYLYKTTGEDYILAMYNTDNELVYDKHFIVSNNYGNMFSNYINIHICSTIDQNRVPVNIENFNENSNAQFGYLCDDQGNFIMGWKALDGEIMHDVVSPIELIDLQCDSYIEYSEYLETNEYVEYEEYLKENNVENKRTGTEIDENGKIWAKYKDGTRNLIGEISIQEFVIPNSLTMIDKNLFTENLGSSEFDGSGVRIDELGIKLKKVDSNIANSIIDKVTERRTTKYVLGIEGNSTPLYFITSNGSTLEFNEELELYGSLESNGYEVSGTNYLSPFDEEHPYCLLDKNGYPLLGWCADETSGNEEELDYEREIQIDTPSVIRFGADTLILPPQATKRARVTGIINNDTKEINFNLVDFLGYEYSMTFDATQNENSFILKLSKLVWVGEFEMELTEEIKENCTFNFTYDSNGIINEENFEIDLSSWYGNFAPITISTSNLKFDDRNSSTAKIERGDEEGRGKGNTIGKLVKISIREDGKIYGIYKTMSDTIECLLYQICVSDSNEALNNSGLDVSTQGGRIVKK